jgi:hypothetical protein
MREGTRKGKERAGGKRREWYRQHLAILLISVLLTGRIGPLPLAMAEILYRDEMQNTASASQAAATRSDGTEKEEDGQDSLENEEFYDKDTAAIRQETGNKDVATPSESRIISVRADGMIKAEAARYYNQTSNDTGAEFGRYADLQPNTSIEIPLSQVEGFTDGDYFIHMRQAGNRQVLTIKAGGKTGRILCKDTSFGWTQDSETKSPDMMTLSSGDTLSVEASTSGAYAHVDWIGLERIEGNVIRFEAKDFLNDNSWLTGSDTCVDMKEGRRLDIPLDSNFKRGIYSFLMVTTGNEREFGIEVNGKEAERYRISATDDPWNLDSLQEDGWQGACELKPGDVITIVSPTDNYGWLRDVMLQWISEPDPDYLENNGIYEFPAKRHYNGNTTGDGIGADLQPGDSIEIPLQAIVPDFKAKEYRIELDYAGTGQIMQAEAGGSSLELILPPGSFDWGNQKTAESMESLNLTGKETLKLTAESGSRYTWVKTIRLVPKTDVRIPVDEKSFDGVAAADIVDGGCVNMPAGKTVTMTLDGQFEEAQYGLQFFHTGDKRSYSIAINGKEAGTYDIEESKDNGNLGTNQLISSGWKGSYKLKAGDTVAITAPDSSAGWIKGVTWKWLSDPQGGFTMDGDTYVFEGERYYQPTGDGQGADLQPHTGIEIPLADVAGFPAGNYLIQAVHAGNGQVMSLKAGEHSADMIFSPGTFDWGSSKTAECMKIFPLTGQETIRLYADTDGKYTWIDKILLTPIAEKRIDLTMEDPIVTVEKRCDDAPNCADMNPGRKLTLKLDSRFVKGQYALLIYHAGNAREYSVLVNGEKAGTYLASGNGEFGTDKLLSNGWQERYELKEGDLVEIIAPEGSQGWIKNVVFKELPYAYYKKDLATGITVEAEAGVIPTETKLTVKAMGKTGNEYFSGQGLRAVGYRVELKYNGQLLDLAAEGREDKVSITVPVPAGIDKENPDVDLYYMTGEEGEPLRAFKDNNGKSLTAAMQGCGIYAVSMEKGKYHYEAEEYYNAWQDEGNAANFEAGNGDSISIPLTKADGFDRGVYNLLVRYSGGNDGKNLTVKVDGKAVGRVGVDFTEWGSYRLVPAQGVLELYATNELQLVTPEGQYQWIDYLELIEAEPFEDQYGDGEMTVHVKAPVGALPYGSCLAVEEPDSGDPYLEKVYERFQADRIFGRYLYFYWGDDRDNRISPSSPVTVRISLEGIPSGRSELPEEKRYTLYHVEGQGQAIKCVKIPSRTEDGYLVFKIAKETGLLAIVEGGVYVPESYDEDSIYIRGGAAVGANALREAANDAGNVNQPVKTRTEGNRYIYEGEAYYKAQSDSLTADLQPGAQMNIKLSDNRDFRAGNYRLTIRSNGNRQKFVIKVNYRQAGSVLRAETSFGMANMTEDTMVETLLLAPSDILTVEGESGESYGWVDYVELTYLSPASKEASGKTVTYRGTDIYEKKSENYPAADLQPGDSLSFAVDSNPDFEEGAYQIAVTSNGNRTRMWVKHNGETAGSIVRVNGNGFEKTDFTCNVMNHTLMLKKGDRISIEAPGNQEEGPWGWVEKVELIPAPQKTGQAKTEYRYDGEDFYQASLYSPAADLQPETSITFPVSNDPDFTEGVYRLSVLSNGTREQFTVFLNGQPVGIIRRKATDYSDIDYSQDYLEALLNLKPGDILTITGQAGDFYGWVNYILLERAYGGNEF